MPLQLRSSVRSQRSIPTPSSSQPNPPEVAEAMADEDVIAVENSTAEAEMDNDSDASNQDDSTNKNDPNASKKDKSAYRQKYKPSWELDTELKDWLTACPTDSFAGYCKYCRTKLHAHKKGLLAHARSSKHKKHLSSFPDALALSDCFNLPDTNGDMDGDGSSKRNHKGQRLFNESWLSDPAFEAWLRKVPNNSTRALCIACRCVITAGRCELIKHTKAAKHKKAMADGNLQEMSEQDLQWLEFSNNDHNLSQNLPAVPYSQALTFKPSMIDLPGMLVDDIIDRLDKHVPLELAEDWDNVGLITKPTQPMKVFNLLLTIDLSEKIVEEAIKKRVQFIISYHPPIFRPIKRLNPKSWMDKAILMCIEHRITVYTPHTALDAIKGGINDWLISSFMTSDQNKVRPLHYSKTKIKTSCLEVLLSEPQETVAQVFKDVHDVTMTDYGNSSTDVKVSCDDKSLSEHIEVLAQTNFAQLSSRVTKLNDVPIPGVGMGRTVVFETPLPLYEVVQRTKTHLDLTYIRMALSPKHTRDTKVKSIAVCAGSGGSVLKGCDADVWITGEMSHHEVLDAINTGSTVILCEHSNTERGFLRDWAQQLRSVVFEDQVMVSVSELDRDPLRIV
uniref:NIF3-like protein 1 n=1 Tax=Aceria tosichella TaxID=561515 RepID=A0A6G1S5R4_9ACAR